jgi:WD40 repeat protein
MRYHAFISYSHAADGKLATSLQSGLQRLAKPLFRLPVIKIFRDQTSLSANPGLWSEIENNLAQSEYFILMASELGARSVWVGKEVDWWLKNRPMDKLLIVVTDGAIYWDTAAADFDWTQTTCLSGNLKAAFKEEPLYVDMRWAKGENDLSLRHSQFRANVLDLAAPLHGRPKDELDSEDIRQYRRTRTLRWSAISIIMLLAIGASIAAVLAIKNATTALSRQYAAEAQLRIGEGRLGDAVISSLKAYRTLDTMEACTALFKTFQASWDFHAVLQGHQAAVEALVFRKEGKELLTWSKDNTLISWDVSQRRPNGKPLHGEPFDARSAVFSPDGRFLATGTTDGKLQIWDSNNLHRLRELTNGNTEEILSLKFNGDGSLLAAGHIDGTVTIWDMNRFRPIQSKIADWNTELIPADFAFRQDGHFLAIANESPSFPVVVGDFPNGNPIANLNPSSLFWVNTRVAFMASDELGKEKPKNFLVIGTSEGVVQIYEQTGNDQAGFRFSHGGIHHSGSVTAIASTPKLLATGGKDGSVNTWSDVQSGNPVTPASWANSPIEGLSFSPNSNYLAAGLEDGTVIVYLEPLERPRYLASVFSQQGEPPKHDSEETNKELKNRLNKRALGKDSPLQNITPIALSPDGKWLLGQNEKLGASLWDTKSFKRIGPPNPWLDLTQQAFSPDNRMLAVVTKDNLLVWDISEGRVVGDLRGHSERVVDLAFSNDGKLLASIDKDGSVILWDPINARRLSDPLLGQGEDEDIRSWLRFDPSGKMLWAEGLSMPAHPDSWIEEICGRFDPVLSKTEWSEMFGNQTYPANCYSVTGDNPIKAN